MELPGHHVCGGRGPAWRGTCECQTGKTKTARRYRGDREADDSSSQGASGIHVVSYAHPILWVQVDTAGAATDPNIAARTAYIRMPVSY